MCGVRLLTNLILMKSNETASSQCSLHRRFFVFARSACDDAISHFPDFVIRLNPPFSGVFISALHLKLFSTVRQRIPNRKRKDGRHRHKATVRLL